MKLRRHLVVEERDLLAGEEWTYQTSGWLFLRIGRGVAYWLARNASQEVLPGGVIVISPAGEGSIRASQVADVQLHSFEFCPALLGGFFTLSERHHLESLGASADPPVRFLPPTHPAASGFAALLEAPLDLDSPLQRSATLGLAVSFFAEELNRKQPPETNGTLALHRFHELIRQMPDQSALEHTPDQLARLCSCSRRHFGRLFREHFGISLRTKQTQLRLLLSGQLLLDTDSNIVEVARKSGYRSLSLFNTLFKKAFGVTPSEWRRWHSRHARASGSPKVA